MLKNSRHSWGIPENPAPADFGTGIPVTGIPNIVAGSVDGDRSSVAPSPFSTCREFHGERCPKVRLGRKLVHG